MAETERHVYITRIDSKSARKALKETRKELSRIHPEFATPFLVSRLQQLMMRQMDTQECLLDTIETLNTLLNVLMQERSDWMYGRRNL